MGWFSASLLFSALAGSPPGISAPAGGVVFIGIYTLLFPFFSWLLTRSRPPSLRLGGGEIELAAERRDAVLVPYEIVSSARVRWWWPMTVLEVFVDAADDPQVIGLGRDGRRPLRKRKGDRVSYRMSIMGLNSPAPDIRDQLRRRGLCG